MHNVPLSKTMLLIQTCITWKAFRYWVFSGLYFLVFGLNMGKYESEKTPYSETFHRSIYFVKYVISNKVATYKLEACGFVRKCFAKISRKNFADNFKRVTMNNAFVETSVLESVFNQMAGINSRLASLMKKSLHQRHLSLNMLEFSALLQESVI